jgi:pyridoxine 5-phosphate synthase
MTALSVNVNKIAVLRNSRGGALPSVVRAAQVAIAAGCHGITVHPRPDQRHIRPHDLDDLKPMLDGVELNIEGNPFAGPQSNGYPGFDALIEKARPQQVTLVPDSDAQITSDHGFEPARDAARLADKVTRYKSLGARVSVFVDSSVRDLDRLREIGVDRIEIYTGPFAHAFALGNARDELKRCADAARAAQSVGLGVNAGHDLDQRNLDDFLRAVPDVLEVSIGHALIGEALYDGLDATVRRYLEVIASVR